MASPSSLFLPPLLPSFSFPPPSYLLPPTYLKYFYFILVSELFLFFFSFLLVAPFIIRPSTGKYGCPSLY
jgi:hypothetical protein